MWFFYVIDLANWVCIKKEYKYDKVCIFEKTFLSFFFFLYLFYSHLDKQNKFY